MLSTEREREREVCLRYIINWKNNNNNGKTNINFICVKNLYKYNILTKIYNKE